MFLTVSFLVLFHMLQLSVEYIYIYIYLFQWGAQALRNMLIVPPGSGIVHQVNLEYLARVVFNSDGLAYPDSLVGTDSHTTMINGLGVVGWGELSFLPLVYIKSIRNWTVFPIIQLPHCVYNLGTLYFISPSIKRCMFSESIAV